MFSHIELINIKKYKAPSDLILESSELFFDYLVEKNLIRSDVKYLFTIVFLDAKEISHYNKFYRNKEVPTDVLSFCTMDWKNVENEVKNENHEELDLGDLLMCNDVIIENSIRFDCSYEEELVRVVVHGILHLLGYDHKGVLGESEEEIFVIQESFIRKIISSGFIK